VGEGNQPSDRTNLLSIAFGSCSLIAEAMGPRRKEEYRAVALSLYSGMIYDIYPAVYLRRLDLLRNEACDWDITGPTLPSLKVLLQSPSEAEPAKTEYGSLVHGLLSSCVGNINDMR
jgi:HEAT repeat-containing protein 5